MTKFSDNQSPKLTFAESAAPSTPASGLGYLYEKTDGKCYFKNDAGTEYDLTAGDGATTYYAPPSVLNYASNYSGSATSVAVTVNAPTTGDNLVCVVYSTGRAPNAVPSQTNVTWTQRYAGNGNGQYITVYTGVVSGTGGTTVTVNFTGTNNQQAEYFTTATAFTSASAAATATAATTALATVSTSGLTVGNHLLAVCCANAPTSSYGALTIEATTLAPFGGQSRGAFARPNTTRVGYWSLSSSAVSYFAALIVLT